MTFIRESRSVKAEVDNVWDLVSDVDRDAEYWSGLSSIRNLRREGNLTEREAVVGFMGQKSVQRIVLNPKGSVELSFLSGPLVGSRVIRLHRLGARNTKVEVRWNIEFSQIPVFAQGFVKSRLEEITREALEKIAGAAESREGLQ